MAPVKPRVFAHFLVPLDGSRLAEAVLPTVASLAGRLGARVTLIHVLEQRPPTTVHGDRHLASATEASSYLEVVAGRLRATGLQVETHVHDTPEGDLARSLIDHADEHAADMVVLCTHGRGGLRGLFFGSIAQQVLKGGAFPILVIHPLSDGGAPPFDLRRILVPVDGRQGHEEACEAAIPIARAFGAHLDLVLVVPTLETLAGERAAAGVLLPTATRAILDLDEQAASGHLESVAQELRAGGITVTSEVLRGDAVPVLLEQADRLESDLIVLASHGQTGLNALFSGSVAPRVTSRTERPLLLVPFTEGVKEGASADAKAPPR